jgi:sulfate permease, SulP family
VGLRLFPSLAGYQRGWLQGDVLAGLTVWAMLVPQALAYASIAGVSPVVGLYAAPAALVFYAAFGSSRHLVVGPMSATAALSAAAVAELATQGSGRFAALTVTLAITTGAIGVIAGLARLGFVANFISEPVLKGFIVGLALTIIVGQLPKLFGVPKGEGNFFEQLWHLAGHLGQTSGLTLLVGLVSLALVLGLRRVAPVVPGSLAAVVFGIVVVQLFGLDRHGAAIVGKIQPGLPPLGLPGVAAVDYLKFAPAAVGILLVGFAEGLGAAKTYAARQHYEVDANLELLGVGAANLGAGLSSGMVVSGSLSKTAVNGAAGARTQLSGLVVAALTIVTLLTLTPLFQEPAPGDVGGGGDRRGDRAGRLPVPGRAEPGLHAPARSLLRRGRPARLHRRGGHPGRGAGVRQPARAVHRHRHVAAAAGLPRLPPAPPCSARSPAPPASTATWSATPTTSNCPAS